MKSILKIMIRTLFTTILFFLSSNVFAATYLVCSKNYGKYVSIKLGNKKIHILKETNEYIDYTDTIIKWNDEIIKLEIPKTRNSNRPVIDEDGKIKKDKKGQTIWNFSSYETTQIIFIDRVSGILNWDAGFDDDKYACEVKKKTLF